MLDNLKLFTFHYVSIKSEMLWAKLNAEIEFTFHYVSIKSGVSGAKDATIQGFTFHYVSIKSKAAGVSASKVTLFTFHYVSIKSIRSYSSPLPWVNLHSTMFLLNPLTSQAHPHGVVIYIPLCFY